MAQAESTVDLISLQERAHKIYLDWREDHVDGAVVTARDVDAQDEDLNVTTTYLDPDPEASAETAAGMSMLGMGRNAFEKLRGAFEEIDILRSAVKTRGAKNQGILIPTLHKNGTFDTAMTHNLLFVASDGKPEFAAINEVVVNPMMGFLDIGGRAVYWTLRQSGAVVITLNSEAAIAHGMTPEDTRALSEIYTPPFRKCLEQSPIVNWSLPGTRGVKVITKGGEHATSISRVPDGIANIARKRFRWAIPVPMEVELGNCRLEVLEPRELNSVDDVHAMYDEMVEVANGFSEEEIYYGMPEGSIKLEEV